MVFDSEPSFITTEIDVPILQNNALLLFVFFKNDVHI